MITVLSPAKTLNFDKTSVTAHTEPIFLAEAQRLVNQLKKMSRNDLCQLMKVSDKISALNHERYQSWCRPFNLENSKQALLAFKGDVYTGISVDDFNQEDLDFAQQHLRMLSGLYGILKPLDLIQPYRLEMGTRLKADYHDNLYEFWGDKITASLNDDLAAEKSPVLINLASNEYFSSVHPPELAARIITPVFKEQKNGVYKVISFLAKKARGMMSRYIIKNRIQDVGAIRKFKAGGYQYRAEMSDDNVWVFTHG